MTKGLKGAGDMAYQNRVFLIGNLTKDAAELRVTPGGKKLTTLNLAVNEPVPDGDKWVEKATFINDIEVWGNQADACVKHLGSGSLVSIEARLRVDQWEDTASGAKRSRMKLVAEPGGVQFLLTKAPGVGAGRASGPGEEEAAAAPPAAGSRTRKGKKTDTAQ